MSEWKKIELSPEAKGRLIRILEIFIKEVDNFMGADMEKRAAIAKLGDSEKEITEDEIKNLTDENIMYSYGEEYAFASQLLNDLKK